MKKTYLLLLAACLYAQPLLAADITVDKAWVRLSPPVADSTAAYATIHNNSNTAITLTGAASNIAKKTELHSMDMSKGTMRMVKLDTITLAAHDTITLAPGKQHLMLMGLKHPLHAGDNVELRLIRANGTAIVIQAPVRDMR
ncbi:MAG: copper chaperone PCu(A)C [Mariprofundaceae bacterium]|nr:copper chaperone PCu(A)C [Mariprofundaceae bacterium]